MIKPQLVAKAEDYLERHCVDKKWFDYRQRLGKPVDLRKIESLKNFIGQLESDTERTRENDRLLAQHVKAVQESSLFPMPLGDDPPPITDAERAQMLETHRNYFANYFFALMEQKLLSEEEVAARARVDAVLFDRLRNDRKYIPAERTIWALVLGLRLNLSDANALMKRVKFYLSGKVMEEVLMAFFLDEGVYDLSTADEVLTHYGFDSLAIREDFTPPPAKNFHDAGLIERIDLYIEKNFRDTSALEEAAKRGVKYSYSLEPLGEPAESLKTFEVIVRALKDKIGIAGTHFSDYLFKLIKQKNLSDVEVYKRAHLDRRIFSKIRNDKSYMPSKRTVLAIAFGLKLDFREANTLLARAGYFLSEGRKEDVIAAYFIDNQIYDLFLINEVLDYYDCPILGD